MTAIERVIARARNEVGYLEKASNAQLDSKTDNAGYNNYNKYARDLDALGVVYNYPKQGYSWCDIFYDWLFITEFGLETAMQMLYQDYKGLGAGCYYSARYYRDHGAYYHEPQIGDQIFFLDSDRDESHTGIVVDIQGDRVFTIEGNTSSASGVIDNGGCVAAKSYHYLYSRIGGYGRPNWDLIKEQNIDTKQNEQEDFDVTKEEIKSVVKEILVEFGVIVDEDKYKNTYYRIGDSGDGVVMLQNALVAKGYSVGKCGVDGDFGDDTYKAVRAFQTDAGLLVDGVAGPKTLAKLFGNK